MRTIISLLDEYGESHQNHTNKLIHWICVPVIFWSITALLWSVKFSEVMEIHLNLAIIAMLLVWIYYIRLSINLAFGMLIFIFLCFGLSYFIENQFGTESLVYTALVIFFLAWIGQFYGHKIEGKKPSFIKDLQFLLVCPAWLLHFIYKKLNISI